MIGYIIKITIHLFSLLFLLGSGHVAQLGGIDVYDTKESMEDILL